MKNAILICLIARYEAKAFTNTYVYGFIYKGAVYAVTCTGLRFGIKLDRASSKNGGGYSIRFAPTEKEKEAMILSGLAELICSEEYFKEFLSDPKNLENLKAEFFIPLMVNKLINDGTATVEVLDTTSKWFGVTYAADRDATVARIKQLVDEGVYPNKLF